MSTGMNVSFVEDDPLNSAIVDGATGHLLFNVSTPFALRRSKTTLCDALGRVIAVYKSGEGASVVTYRDQPKTKVSDWLPEKGSLLSSTRILTVPNGKVYEWKQRLNSRSFKLVDPVTKAHVAETHSATTGVFSAKRYMRIDVSLEVVPFLEIIVLSFIICENKRRDRGSQSASNGASAAAASASAAAAAAAP